MNACVPRSMPLAQVTSGADPGGGEPRRHFATRLGGRRDENRVTAREPASRSDVAVDRAGQIDAGQPVAAPGPCDGPHSCVIAAPQDDRAAGGRGRVRERNAPGAGAGDADPAIWASRVSRRIAISCSRRHDRIGGRRAGFAFPCS